MEIQVSRSPHGPFERILFRAKLDRIVRGQPLIAEVSVYRLGDTLIDTGSSHVASTLISCLQDQPPHRIILTHQHEDHVGGVNAVRKAFGDIPVYAPKAHIPIIENTHQVEAHRELYWGHPDAPQGLIPYSAGQTFEIKGLVLETHETPGHTPGHICLTTNWGQQTFGCTGDLYFGSKFIPAFFESAADDLVASQRMMADFADSLYMLPTHGKVRPNGREILLQAAENIAREAQKVQQTAEDLGETDLLQIRKAHFPGIDPQGQLTGGEVSELAFIRSVMEPVRSLPASSLSHYFD